jgi:hypothetical protein
MKKNYSNLKVKSRTLLYIKLVLIVCPFVANIVGANAATYFSQGTSGFSTLANWNTIAGGGGTNPIAGDLTSGLHTFIVQNGHVVTVNQDVSIAALTIQGGAFGGSLVIGDNTTSRNLNIAGTTSISAPGSMTVGVATATHTVTFRGNITNSGVLNLFNNSSSMANAVLNAAAINVSGVGAFTFANFSLATAPNPATVVTLNSSAQINGSVNLATACTLNDGNLLHTVAGDWNEAGTAQLTGNGTIEFNSPLIQQISAAATFFNVNVNTPNLILSGATTVNGNLSLLDTSNIIASTNVVHTVLGNLNQSLISSINHTNGTFAFTGSNAQTIDIDNSIFFNMSFSNGGAVFPKTLNGELILSRQLTINNTAYVISSGAKTIGNIGLGAGGIRIDGDSDFSGTTTFIGNQAITINTNAASINIGTTEIISNTTSALTFALLAPAVASNFNIQNNITINSGSFVIANSVSVTGLAGFGIDLGAGCSMTCGGTNNFPTGFTNFNFNTTSTVNYNAAFAQVVRGGISYGNLTLTSNTKTIDDSLEIKGNLALNSAVVADLVGFKISIRGNISANVAGSILNNDLDVFINSPNTAQTLGGNITYNLKNITFTLDAPSSNITKTISTNLNLTGNFNATALGGSVANQLILEFTTFSILGNGSGIFNLGSFVRLNTSGAISFRNSMLSFASRTLDPASTIRYANNTAFSNQFVSNDVVYGNLDFGGTGIGGLYSNKSLCGNITIVGSLTRDAGGNPLLRDSIATQVEILGNYYLRNVDYPNPSLTCTFLFNGGVQNIGIGASGINLPNVVFANSGTKFFAASSGQTVFVFGNLVINDGVTVDASNKLLNLRGNFIASGAGTSGRYLQLSTATTTLSSTTSAQNIYFNSASNFGALTINKPAALTPERVVNLIDDVICTGNLTLISNAAELNATSKIVTVGGNFTLSNSTGFLSTGSTVVLNGTGGTQTLSNGTPAAIFNNFVCSGTALKSLAGSATIFNGDVTINNSTFAGNNIAISVIGNWNIINSGSFTHTNIVSFNGVNQTISSSSFNSVVFANSGTKTLSGNISTNSAFTINTGVTLDATTTNYNVSVSGNYINNGTFLVNNNTVTFSGGAKNITTGGIGAGKRFFNVTINSTSLSPNTLIGNIEIVNDLTVISGSFTTGANDVNLAGNLLVTDNANASYNANNVSILTFNASSGTKQFNPGNPSISVFRQIVVNAPGVIYNVVSNSFVISSNQPLTLSSGRINLNGNSLTLTSGNVNIAASATLSIDAGSELQLSNTASLNNNGGNLRIVGSVNSRAFVRRNGAVGGFTINQTSGNLEARYFQIENSATTGFSITGGTIDATNNLSNGIFSGGSGTQYLNFASLSLAGGFTINNTEFYSGPTFNVTKTAATSVITFNGSTGSLAGEAFDNDAGNVVNWIVTSKKWTGLALDNQWNTANNWSPFGIPSSNDTIYIDHSNVMPAISVQITGTNAVCARLILDVQGGTPVTLTIGSGRSLSVGENVNILAGSTLTQTDNTSLFNIGGSYLNVGTLNNGNSTITFNGAAGNYVILSGGNNFYNLSINSSGGEYLLGSAITVNNNLSILSGTLDVSSANYQIDIAGNWLNSSPGIFVPRLGTVVFSGGIQSISGGGPFYNLNTSGTNIKSVITGSLAVNNDLTINTGSGLNAGTSAIAIGRNWVNNTVAGFTQTGTGSVIFSGVLAQTIDGGTQSTTFNNLVFQNGGSKTFARSCSVTGDFTAISGCGNLDFDIYLVTGLPTKNFFVNGATLLIVRGVSNFPSGFGSVSLANNSTVRYQADGNQIIYPTSYGILDLRRSTVVNNTKTSSGSFSVVGNLAITDVNTQLIMNNDTLTLSSTFTFPASGRRIVWGANGTLVHNGTNFTFPAAYTAFGVSADPGPEFNNVVLSGTGTKTLAAHLNVSGNVIVQSGVSFTMSTFKLTGSALRTFSMQGGSILNCAIPAATGLAFPTGFSNYSLTNISTTNLNGGANPQTISVAPIYGNLNLTNTSTSTISAAADTLFIAGNFNTSTSTLLDNNKNIKSTGAIIDVRLYTPSVGTSIVLAGGDQGIYDASGANPLDIMNIAFTNSGVKTIALPQVNTVNINGNLQISAGVIVNCTNRDINFYGSSFVNNGSFNHLGNGSRIFSFLGTNTQTINLGSGNLFQNPIVFNKTSNPVNFVSNGGNFIRNNALISVFDISAGTVVDMGTLTHQINGTITNLGTWNTSNANLVFAGAAQLITTPTFIANNITISGTGSKQMGCDWNINDLTINAGTNLTTTASNYNLFLNGNWLNDGTFTVNSSSVYFESNNITTKTITAGASVFRDVYFNNTLFSNRTYNLISSSTTFSRQLNIGSGATLNLNGNTLVLGSNNAFAEIHTVQAGGTLVVNSNANLRFNNDNGNSTLNVDGSISIVGDNSFPARINRNTNVNRINITVNGSISARYYTIDFLSDAGLNVTSSATINATNNFSDGIFSNINTALGTPKYYLLLNGSLATAINNVVFNFTGTPTAGIHFNVQRTTAPFIQFNEVISGALGTFVFESDDNSALSGLLRWPLTLNLNWTGAINRNWNLAGNWNPAQVPTATDNAIIPLVTNNPLITTANAICKNLTITNGNLGIENGFDLSVQKDIIIGTALNNGILSVLNNTSDITIGGSWTRGTNALFINGSSTVIFNGISGIHYINPLSSAFHNLTINGTNSTFFINATTLNINGNFNLIDGTVTPNNTGYNYSVKANYFNSGVFNTFINGTFTFNGTSNQNITNGSFVNVVFTNASTKTIINNAIILGTSLISSSATLASNGSGTIDFRGNVTFNTGTNFNDGGNLHLFSGTQWTGNNNNITNAGGIRFNRNGAQTIAGAKLSSLILEGTGNKTLLNNVFIDGNVTLKTGTGNLNLQTFTLNSTNNLGVFTIEPNTSLYIRGSNNFPSNFLGYDFDITSITYYDAAIDQLIGAIDYGGLSLANATTKTLTGNTTITGNLTFNASTLDVTTSNYILTLGGNYNNNSTGSFICRQGEVVFNGSIAGTQFIYNSNNGTKTFNKVTVNKPSNLTAQFNNGNPVINGDLSVNGGILDVAANTVSIKGSLIISTSGQALASGTFLFNNSIGTTKSIQTNGSILNNITINAPTSTYQLLDNLQINGDFQLVSGNFNGNGFVANLGNGNEAVNISSGTIYTVGAGGRLELGNNVTCTVNGTLNLIGTNSAISVVSNNASGGRYTFVVNGNIAAQNYLFEQMSVAGIQINATAIVDAINNFSNGTFSNGAAGGTYLRIENSQTFTANNVTFAVNPGGSAKNVTKTISNSGVVTFNNYSGVFSGTAFEQDSYNLIDWIGPIVLTWNGSVDTDWYTAANWTPSSGPAIIPNISTDVIVAVALNQPIINLDGATANKLTINTGSTLSINTPLAFLPDFVINSDLIINGSLLSNGAADTILIAGNWSKSTGGIFNCGNSTVIFNSISGSNIINCGNSAFNNLEINGPAYFQLGSIATINGNFKALQGTFDVSSANYAMTVRNNWICTGTFLPRTGNVNLVANSGGTKILNMGLNSFNNLSIASSFGAIYNVTSNDLRVKANTTINSGTLNINNFVHFNGDNSGFDALTVFGTYSLGNSGILKNGNNASVIVNNGGSFIGVGSSNSINAKITRQTIGFYSFNINTGATIALENYQFSYLNSSGIVVQSGAIIHPTNNFSNGSFNNGITGGRSIDLQNDFADFTVTNVEFNSGAVNNVKRLSGTGVITFLNANGLYAGEDYEEDDGSAVTGLVRWTLTEPIYTWTGNVSTNWNTPANWNDQFGNPSVIVPNSTLSVKIPDVSSGSNNFPIISAANANCASLEIYAGASLTINSNRNLSVNGSLINNGTLTSQAASNSTITVGNLWANTSVFNAGSSTVVLSASSGYKTLATGGSSFNNLTVSGGAITQPNSSVTILGNLLISSGTLDIVNPLFQLTIGGNWTNNGIFMNGNNTVVFNKASGTQTVSNPSGETFYNLTISNTGTVLKTVVFSNNSVLAINGNLNISSTNSQLNGGNNNFTLKGNWTNNGLPFISTGTVNFIGTSNQKINKIGQESFNNLVISNSSIAGVEIETDLAIANDIDLGTTGRLFFGSTASSVELTKMTALSNTFKGGPLTLIDLSGANHQLIIGCENPGFSGTFISGTTSTVNYNRNNLISGSGGQQTILTSLTYANLNLTGTDEKNTAGSFTVKSNLLLNGISVNLKANVPSSTLNIGGNITLQNGAIMDNNCIDNLQLITNGNVPQLFSGNGQSLKCFKLNSTKTAGGITLVGLNQTNLIVKDDLILNYTSLALFSDGGNAITVGDDLEVGSNLSNTSNYNFTGEIELNGLNENAGIHISQVDQIGSIKAKLNNLKISTGANTINDLVSILPIAGGNNFELKGNLEINQGANSSQLNPNNNNLFVGGNWNIYNNTAYINGTENIEFNGNAFQTISCGSVQEFKKLKLNKASNNLQLNCDLLVTEILDLSNGKILLNGNDIELGTNLVNATIQNQSNSSYIVTYDGGYDGKINQHINAVGSYQFPTGDINNYSPINVQFNNASLSNAVLSAYLMSEAHPMISGSTNYLNKYWNVEPIGISNVNYNISFTYADADIIGSESLLYAFKHNNDGWLGAPESSADFVHGTSSSLNFATNTFSWNGLFTFSDFTGIGDGAPLPISLLYFDAKYNGEFVDLKWATMSETQNDYFEVEKTTDGINFESVCKQNGAGNNNGLIEYYDLDKNITYGKSYYRLKQVDFNGKMSYSQLKVVDVLETDNEYLNVFQNNGIVRIYCQTKQPINTHINFFNLAGQLVKSERLNFVSGTNSQYISISELPSGIYLLNINNNQNKSYKILKD